MILAASQIKKTKETVELNLFRIAHKARKSQNINLPDTNDLAISRLALDRDCREISNCSVTRTVPAVS